MIGYRYHFHFDEQPEVPDPCLACDLSHDDPCTDPACPHPHFIGAVSPAGSTATTARLEFPELHPRPH